MTCGHAVCGCRDQFANNFYISTCTQLEGAQSKKFQCKSSSCICNNNSCKAQISFTVPLYICLAFYFCSTEYLHMHVGVRCTFSILVEFRQTVGNGQLGGLSLIVFSATCSHLLSADLCHGQVEVR